MQERYLQTVEQFVDEHPEVASSLPRTDVHDVIRLWRNALETFRSGNVDALSGKVDWVCKHRLFEALRTRSGGKVAQCKLEQLDLDYHDVANGTLYDSLLRRGALCSLDWRIGRLRRPAPRLRQIHVPHCVAGLSARPRRMARSIPAIGPGCRCRRRRRWTWSCSIHFNVKGTRISRPCLMLWHRWSACIYESGARSRFMDRAPLSYSCSAISLRDSKAVSVVLDRFKSGFTAVFRHHLRLQLLRAWRRPCNASAPASMVARMRSSEPPPDARIGISG